MRSEDAYLADILLACEAISNYCAGQSLESFQRSAIVRDAVFYQMMIIGEATRYRTDQTKAKMPSFPWTLVRRARNVLIHDYLNVDETIIWETVVRDIPVLAEAVRSFLHPNP